MPSRRAKLSAFVLPFILVAGAAGAEEYFVSPGGDNSNAGTSASAPWKTIAKANSALAPGDVVYLRGGKYLDDPIKPARSGTANARIVYAAYENETPVLTSNKINGLGSAIELSDRSYITIDGIHIDGVNPPPKARVEHFLTMYNGSYNTIVNCDFRYAHGWHGIRISEGSHHVKLLNNFIDMVGIYDLDGEDFGDSLQIIRDSHHNLVEGNFFSRGSHNLLQLKGNYNVVRNNVFENDWSEIAGSGKGGRNLEVLGRYNVFEHNVVRKARGSIDKDANAGMKAEGRDNIVRFNVIYDNSNEGLTTAARSSQRWAHDNRIYHNTIYSNSGAGWGLIYYQGGNGVARNVFKNNVLYANSSNGAADIVFDLKINPMGLIGESRVENNLITSTSLSGPSVDVRNGGGRMSFAEAEKKYPGHFTNNILAAAKFSSSNPQKPADFALVPGSPGIDAAAPLTHTRSGGSGKSIPVEDASYFSDGFSIVAGDRIRIDGGPPLTVKEVDRGGNTLVVAENAEWTKSAGVTLEYYGDGPDIGAYEEPVDGDLPLRRPKAPSALSGTPR